VLTPTTPLLEVIARVSLVYLALTVLLRLCGKREIGQLSPLDLLGMLLLSETVSPALTGGDQSLPAALLAAATLLALAVLVSRIGFRSRRAERWLDGAPTRLVDEGRCIDAAIRSERITEQELESALRRHGLLGVAELGRVRGAWVEPNGEITVVQREG
jgi:uncharacterized membrane protein YcaP (DUF421 family)